MRHALGSAMPGMADRLSRAIPLQALQPFDGDEFLLAATAQNLRKLPKLNPLPAPIFAT
jgi:hypothetical protein